MHVLGMENVLEVLLEVSPLAMQVRPQRVKHCKGLMQHTQHAQHLHDLDIVVEWALRGRMSLINVMDKCGVINLHFGNVRNV